jgi:predicted ester cyclase
MTLRAMTGLLSPVFRQPDRLVSIPQLIADIRRRSDVTGRRCKMERMSLGDHDPSQVVRRLIDEVMNQRNLDVLDELYVPRMAAAARRWVEPFLNSFSDVQMRIVELVLEGETVVGRFSCSGTHTGTWLGHGPTGRRFTNVAEVYFFVVVNGRITRAWGLEDTVDRLRQLGLSLPDGQADRPN